MKYLKVYENNENEIKDKKLSKLISKYFFSNLEEFDRILIEKDDQDDQYMFNICFDEIFKETIEQVEKFHEFFDYEKTSWSFATDNFTYDSNPKIFTWIYLHDNLIYKYLNKFDMLNQSNKYNL